MPTLDGLIFPYNRQSITRDVVSLSPFSPLPSPLSNPPSPIPLSRPERWMLSWLEEGLVHRDTVLTASPGLQALRFHTGMVAGQKPTGVTDTDRWITGTIAAQLTSTLLAVTTVRVVEWIGPVGRWLGGQRLLDDPTYVGKRFRESGGRPPWGLGYGGRLHRTGGSTRLHPAS